MIGHETPGDWDNETGETSWPPYYFGAATDALGDAEKGHAETVTADDLSTRIHRYKVLEEYGKLRARDEARRLIKAEQAGPGDRPKPDILSDLLAEPDEETTYRLDRLWPANGRVLWAAQFKAGKTTGVGNVIRSLVDGDPFLGEFDVAPLAGRRVALLDTEMDRGTLRRWLRDQHIRDTRDVVTYSLRGRLASLDLLDAETRRMWALQLASMDVGVVILDCLRPVLDSLALDENTDAGRFLVAFDTMLNEAQVGEALIVHHMGHTGERSRGSSRLRDWPDVEWKLVREQSDTDDPSAPRYFSAYGRDVDVTESALAYDPTSRHLSLTGAGNRKQAAGRTVVPAVLELLEYSPEGLSGRAIEEALTAGGEKQKTIRDALKMAIRDGAVLTTPGPRRSVIHTLPTSSASVRQSASPVRQRSRSECVSASIGDALHSLPADPSESEPEPDALNLCCETRQPMTPRCNSCSLAKSARRSG